MTGVHVRMRVGDELYALPVEHVVEVAELGELAPVPGAPAAFLGVRNLRGQVLPVADLALLLGLPRAGEPRRLVVAEDGARTIGLAIDDVTDVGPLGGTAEEADSPFLEGVALAEGALVGIVDVARVLEALEPGEPA